MFRIAMTFACALAVIAGSMVPTAVIAAAIDHGYFDALVARPEHWKSFSLRDPGQLETRANGGYAYCNSCPLDVTYDPTNDLDLRRQDAAKVLIPAGKNNLRNQVRVPMNTSDGNTYLVTWDAWFGSEYKYANTGIATQKSFQFASNGNIWTEIQSRFSQGGGDGVSKPTGRAYIAGNQPPAQAFGPNVTNRDPLQPMTGSFTIRPEVWTRYWVLFDQRANDYDLVSLWVADPSTGPVQIFDKLQLNAANGRIDEFWLEFNTSTDSVPFDRGPLVAYVRNIAMLRNVDLPTSLMQRPNAGTPLPPPPPRPGTPRNLRVIPPLW